jgi:hypothetical protein
VLKKYLPFIILIAAASLYWYVKKNQRGKVTIKPPTEHVTIPVSPETNPNRDEGFNRRATAIVYSKHARCRMECRHIDESEVKEILESGNINYNKVESDARGKTYPLEGVTHDNQRVRIVFAPKDNGEMVVVTCIDLDKDWSCDCK